jgi:hypothetical protein
MFGVNLRGVYQVRTQQNVDFVVDLAAASTVGLEEEEENIPAASIISAADTTIVATSTRPWFDRPRNERKFLQRLAQALVLLGLNQYENENGEIGGQQWQVAGILALASNFIMKENLIEGFITKQKKRGRGQ